MKSKKELRPVEPILKLEKTLREEVAEMDTPKLVKLAAEVEAMDAKVPGFKVLVQQFLHGGQVEEFRETKHYFILEAKGAGLRLRYTAVAGDGIRERHAALTGSKADNCALDWIVNRTRGKEVEIEKMPEAIYAFSNAFWHGEKSDLVDEREEDVEYIEVRSFKLVLRMRVDSWRKKLDKWSSKLYLLRPKDAGKRRAKAEQAKASLLMYLDKKIRERKDQRTTTEEREAHVKVIQEHVLETVKARNAEKMPGQGKLEV